MLLMLIGVLVLSSCAACNRVRVPGQKQPPQIELQKAPEPKAAPNVDVKTHDVAIDVGLEGREYSFEGVRFTHVSIMADDSMEWPVKVWVSLNDEFSGFIYADGWEDESPKKELIKPGEKSKWVPLRGSWLTGANILKLRFITPGPGGVDIPARYFKGTMYLRDDPDAPDKDGK